jgi:hypothetical protein
MNARNCLTKTKLEKYIAAVTAKKRLPDDGRLDRKESENYQL